MHLDHHVLLRTEKPFLLVIVPALPILELEQLEPEWPHYSFDLMPVRRGDQDVQG